MSIIFLRTSIFIFFAGSGIYSLAPESTDLSKQRWIHGSADCKTNRDPLIQIVACDAHTWILRQNKCIHYEAPFIFLFSGNEQSLLVDTGATSDEKKFPLRHVVDSILNANGSGNRKLIVAHTHSHGDHVAADEQFKTRANTTVIGMTLDEIQKYFGFDETNSMATMDLGNRSITVLSIPGHHPASLAFFDSQTKLLFTGDTFYPGRLYVSDWPAFKKSVKRILRYAEEKNATEFIGNHIEMTSKKGVDYPEGTTFQPDEHVLPLTIGQLKELDIALNRLGDRPKLEVHDHFIIYPK